MADGHGGYRRPADPATTSGPGRLSRRTDGGPSQGAKVIQGGEYGEGQELLDLQQSAPMAAMGDPGAPMDGGVQAPAVTPVPLGADSMYPDEPITTGVAAGLGAGPEAMMLPDPDTEWVRELAPYLPSLNRIAAARGASPAMRRAIRTIKVAQT